MDKPHTLLYIDDYVADRVLLRRAVEQGMRNVQVLAVDSGDEGVKAAQLYLPDMVVVDLNMPGMEGEDVLKALKGNTNTRHIPVVVLSAEDNPVRAMELKRLGAAEYLLKPMDMHVLVDTLRSVLTRHLAK